MSDEDFEHPCPGPESVTTEAYRRALVAFAQRDYIERLEALEREVAALKQKQKEQAHMIAA